jgi:hypothetical protein
MPDHAKVIPRVVHCKREPYDVYIGRPSKWGNPWEIRGFSRVEVIRLYERYILDSELIYDIGELRGKTLGCWCAPKACHGDILLRLANP